MVSQLILTCKKYLKLFVRKAAPFTHFIPASLRHRAAQAMLQAAKPWKYHQPASYEPGRFPNGVNLFGFFKAENGLAQGTKLYAASIEAAGIPHTFLNTDFLDWLPQLDTTFDSRLSKEAKYAVNIVHINPDQWEEACLCYPEESFDHHYNIGVWLWELETIPHSWKSCLANVDELWAPSEFIASALRKETDKPVTVIPYGIAVPANETLSRADFGLPEDRFLVLTMYDSNSYSSRKNPGASMKAFREAFSGLPGKGLLVIKVGNPKDEDLAFIRESMQGVDYMLITERMEKSRLNSLISLCDVFISLHRSEGFGLVMAEAMALHTAVIATNWSSNTEFMDRESCCMVDYSLIPVNDNYQFGQQEHRWADADVHQAAAYLQKLYADPGFLQEKTEKAYQKISAEFSVTATSLKMKARLSEIFSHSKE